PVKLHQSRLRDAVGEVPSVAADHVAITAAAQQQRRRLNTLNRRPNIGAQVKVDDRLEVTGAARQAPPAPPPAPLAGIPSPTGRQVLSHCTSPGGLAEGVDIPGE